MIRVVLIADVVVYLESLSQVLSRGNHFRVVGLASTPDEGVAVTREHEPEVVLIDGRMPASSETAKRIRNHTGTVKVVAMAVPETDEAILQFAEAGVAGYVLESATLEDLVVAVQSAARGELIVPPRMAFTLLRRIGKLAKLVSHPTQGPPVQLTSREQQILQLVNEAMSNKDIARRLGLEVATVKHHVHSILKKLHVHKRIEAAEWFRRAGFHLRLEA